VQNPTKHQRKQIDVINRIEEYFKKSKVSIVTPAENFATDPRICLTSVHFPKKRLIKEIEEKITSSLKNTFPESYYYKATSLHMTIKNVRVIYDPPTFTEEDVVKAKKAFSEIIPKHKQFKVYFYRLILFPYSLSLLGTTDPERDKIVLNLDKALKRLGVPDDKKYANKRYFFGNITLARFRKTPSEKFKKMVNKISKSLSFKPYNVDSVTLIVTNASLSRCKKVASWNLQT